MIVFFFISAPSLLDHQNAQHQRDQHHSGVELKRKFFLSEQIPADQSDDAGEDDTVDQSHHKFNLLLPALRQRQKTELIGKDNEEDGPNHHDEAGNQALLQNRCIILHADDLCRKNARKSRGGNHIAQGSD